MDDFDPRAAKVGQGPNAPNATRRYAARIDAEMRNLERLASIATNAAEVGRNIGSFSPAKAALAAETVREAAAIVSKAAIQSFDALQITTPEWVDFWLEAGKNKQADVERMRRGAKAQQASTEIVRVTEKAQLGRIAAGRLAVTTHHLKGDK